VVAALIPDVMRIDTTITSAGSAYANGAVAVGTTVRPVAGRKLEDDVIDITYQVLTGKGGLGDGVPYTRPAAARDRRTPPSATSPWSATFPFLAAPN
jgi:hypothetical protein